MSDSTPEVDGPRGADQFIRDDRTEKVLVDNDVAFQFNAISLADIDLSAFDIDTNPERQMRDHGRRAPRWLRCSAAGRQRLGIRVTFPGRGAVLRAERPVPHRRFPSPPLGRPERRSDPGLRLCRGLHRRTST